MSREKTEREYILAGIAYRFVRGVLTKMTVHSFLRHEPRCYSKWFYPDQGDHRMAEVFLASKGEIVDER